MNRSAKAGARSSPHYGGEDTSTHPAYQGVCGWQGAEVTSVTQGRLERSIRRELRRAQAISKNEMRVVCRSSCRRAEQYLKLSQQKLSDRKGE